MEYSPGMGLYGKGLPRNHQYFMDLGSGAQGTAGPGAGHEEL